MVAVIQPSHPAQQHGLLMLHAAITPLAGVPVVAMSGAVRSEVHVAVRDALAVFPQPSVTFHVLV